MIYYPMNIKDKLFSFLNLILLLYFVFLDGFILFFILFILFFLFLIKSEEFFLLFLKRTPPIILLLPLTLINFVFYRDSIWRSYVLLLPLLFYFVYLFINYDRSKINIKNHRFVLIILLLTVYLLSLFSYKGKILFSGDEPHYLVVAGSILHDGDLNIANNQSLKETKLFWNLNKPLPFHGYFGKKGRKYIYSFHMPAISIMILPFFILGEFFKNKILFFFIIRMGVIFWGLLAALQFYKFLILSEIKDKTAFWATLLTFTVSPYLFFSTHLYPSIFLTFLILYSINNFYFEKKNYLKVSIAMSIMIWAGVKAILIVFMLLLIILLKEKLNIFKTKFLLRFSPLVFSFLSFFYYLYYAYGSFSILSIYNGVLTPEKKRYLIHLILSFKMIPFTMRFDSLLNYFLDQRDGLVYYFPLFFFLFPAFILFFKKKYKKFWLLSLPFIVHIINYAFNTHRGGYCPPARPISPFTWFLSFMILLFLMENRDKNINKIFSVFLAFSLFFEAILIKYPLLMYQTTTHEITSRGSALLNFLSNSIFKPYQYVSSYLKINNYNYLPNLIWIILIIVGTFLIIKNKNKIISYSLYLIMIFITLTYLSFPFFKPSLYPRYKLSKDIILLRTSGNISINENNKLKIYGLGRKFLPFFIKGEKPVKLKLSSKYEYRLKVYNDLKKILDKKGKTFILTIKPIKNYGTRKFIPVFIKTSFIKTSFIKTSFTKTRFTKTSFTKPKERFLFLTVVN